MAKTSEVLLRYQVDKASVNNVLLAGDQILRSQQAIGTGGVGGKSVGGMRGKISTAGQQVSMLGGMAGFGGQAGQAISSLSSAIGTLGPIGVATTAAVVVLGIALAETKKKMEEAKKATEATIDVIKDRAQLETKTSEELEKIRAQREQDIQVATKYRDDLAELNQLMKDADEGMRGFDGVIYDLKQSLSMAGAEQATVEAAYKAANVEVDKATGLLENVAGAFDSVGNAAADAAQSMRQSAIAAGDRIRLETEAGKRGVEASQERLASLETERAALQTELDILKQSGDTSEQTTARIQELEKQLNKLGMEAGVVSDAISSGAAAAVDAAKKAADEEKKAAADRERITGQIEQSNQRYADSLSSIGRQTREAITDAKRGQKDRIKDLAQGLTDTFADAALQSQQELQGISLGNMRDEQAAARDNQRTLNDIRREGARSEQDAIRNRDFLAMGRLAEDAKMRLEDTREQFSQQAIERNIANQLEMDDFRSSQGRQRQETLRGYERNRRDLQTDMSRQMRDMRIGRERQLRLARDAHQKEIQMAQQAMRQLLQLDQQFWQQRINMANQATGRGQNSAAQQALQALNQIGITS